MNTLVIILGGISIVVNIWSAIMIHSCLRGKGVKTHSFILINFFIFRYLKDYKEITKSENGKTGYLYYLWLFSINFALLCAVLLLLSGSFS
jgi:hypothetical protein